MKLITTPTCQILEQSQAHSTIDAKLHVSLTVTEILAEPQQWHHLNSGQQKNIML